jgi:iron(III) transport system permease protein
MSLDALGDLNWLAVIVAAVAFFGLGAIWYAPPVFGRAWARSAGVELPEGEQPGAAFYIGPFATCLVSTIATALAIIIGVIAAFLVQRTDVPFKTVFKIFLVMPFAIPPLFAAMGWVQLAGPVGLITQAYQSLFDTRSVPWNIYSPGGIIFVLAVTNYPFVFITVAGALQRVDPSLEEAARTAGVGTWRIMRDITLPVVRPAIYGGGLLAFVSSIDNFGIPAVLGLRAHFYVLTTRIYEALTIPNMPLATAMSVLLVLVALISMTAFRYAEGGRGQYSVIGGKSVTPSVMRLGRARMPVTIGLASFTFVIVVFPLFALVLTSFLRFWGADLTLDNMTLQHYSAVLSSSGAQRGIINSLFLAPAAANILVVATAFISYLNIKARMRGAGLLDAAGLIPFALPGSVIGVAMILAWSNPPIGPALYGTIWILLLAYVMRYMAFGLQTTRATLQQIHASLEEAALASGAGRLRVMRDITFPLLRPGMVAGWVLIFISAFNELTVSVPRPVLPDATSFRSPPARPPVGVAAGRARPDGRRHQRRVPDPVPPARWRPLRVRDGRGTRARRGQPHQHPEGGVRAGRVAPVDPALRDRGRRRRRRGRPAGRRRPRRPHRPQLRLPRPEGHAARRRCGPAVAA